MMNNSTWVKNEIETQFGDCEHLGDVIRKIENLFAKRGHVVCEIRVNGMILSEEDESKFSTSKRSELNEIAIVTNEPNDLIRQALYSAIEFMPGFRDSSVEAAEFFRDMAAEGPQRFTEVIENCQWIVETLRHVRGAANGIDRPLQDEERWTDAEEKLSDVVREILGASEKHDQVLIADLLEYELSTVADLWLDVLEEELKARA